MEVIIWLLCGVVCYLIAQKKNRNVWVGALLGCLFGIFAIIGYLVVSKKEVTSNDTATTA